MNGFSKADNVERVHRKFLKRLLGVKINTNNNAIYGELGRYPLYINRYVRIIKYFLKLNSILQNQIYLPQLAIQLFRQGGHP